MALWKLGDSGQGRVVGEHPPRSTGRVPGLISSIHSSPPVFMASHSLKRIPRRHLAGRRERFQGSGGLQSLHPSAVRPRNGPRAGNHNRSRSSSRPRASTSSSRAPVRAVPDPDWECCRGGGRVAQTTRCPAGAGGSGRGTSNHPVHRGAAGLRKDQRERNCIPRSPPGRDAAAGALHGAGDCAPETAETDRCAGDARAGAAGRKLKGRAVQSPVPSGKASIGDAGRLDGILTWLRGLQPGLRARSGRPWRGA